MDNPAEFFKKIEVVMKTIDELCEKHGMAYRPSLILQDLEEPEETVVVSQVESDELMGVMMLVSMRDSDRLLCSDIEREMNRRIADRN